MASFIIRGGTLAMPVEHITPDGLLPSAMWASAQMEACGQWNMRNWRAITFVANPLTASILCQEHRAKHYHNDKCREQARRHQCAKSFDSRKDGY